MHPTDLLESSFRLVKTQKGALKKLGLLYIEDLLFHFPTRYGENVTHKHIAALSEGDTAIVRGRIMSIKKTKAFRKKMSLTHATIADASGKLRVVWFHQPYTCNRRAELYH